MGAASISPVPYSIYALIDPLTDVVRYVGMTNNLPRRIVEHFSLRGSNLLLKAWIAGLAVTGYVPVVKVLEVCDRKEVAAIAEAAHITAHKDTVYNLVA